MSTKRLERLEHSSLLYDDLLTLLFIDLLLDPSNLLLPYLLISFLFLLFWLGSATDHRSPFSVYI